MNVLIYLVVWAIVLGFTYNVGGKEPLLRAVLAFFVMSIVVYGSASQSQGLKDKVRPFWTDNQISANFYGDLIRKLQERKPRKRNRQTFWEMFISLISPPRFAKEDPGQSVGPKTNMHTHVLRFFWNILISLSFAIPLLGYLIAGASTMALLRPGLQEWQGPWHAATAASYVIGGLAQLIWGYFATSECRAFLDRSPSRRKKQRNKQTLRRAWIACAAEYSLLFTYGSGMVLGVIISANQPEKKELNWWAIAHQYASDIQGPRLLAYIWLFYIGYMLMIKHLAKGDWYETN